MTVLTFGCRNVCIVMRIVWITRFVRPCEWNRIITVTAFETFFRFIRTAVEAYEKGTVRIRAWWLIGFEWQFGDALQNTVVDDTDLLSRTLVEASVKLVSFLIQVKLLTKSTKQFETNSQKSKTCSDKRVNNCLLSKHLYNSRWVAVSCLYSTFCARCHSSASPWGWMHVGHTCPKWPKHALVKSQSLPEIHLGERKICQRQHPRAANWQSLRWSLYY